jgi:transposase-like protein
VAFAVKHVRAAQAAGRSLHAAAAELGLSSMTLDKWLSRAGQSTGRGLREVVVCEATVEAAPDARTVEVQTACGHVVRGLSVADAASLLRALT